MSFLTLDQTTLFYCNLSNTYNKNQARGLRENIGTWTYQVTANKPPSEQSNSTPSLTSQSVTSTRRPPSSVVSRASALSNGIRVTGARENGLREVGAISDRDETIGEELEAKKASPVKGGVRISSNVSTIKLVLTRTHNSLNQDKIKLEPGAPAPVPGVRKVSRSTNKSMPPHFQEGPTWKTYIVPSIIKWAGTQPKVFKIPNTTLVPVLQTVCRHYFDDDTITFDLRNDPTVGLVREGSLIKLILINSTDHSTLNGHIQRSDRFRCYINPPRFSSVSRRHARLGRRTRQMVQGPAP